MPLPVTGNDILLVKCSRSFIQPGYWLEIADLELCPLMLKAMSQHMDKAVPVASQVKGLGEFPLQIAVVLKAEPLPCLRLGILYEIYEGFREQP